MSYLRMALSLYSSVYEYLAIEPPRISSDIKALKSRFTACSL